MNARAAVGLFCAGVLLTACGTASTPPPPAPDGTGSPAANANVTLSVAACEPGLWCVGAGANPSTSLDSLAIETSAGGHGKWAVVATPSLNGATLSAAACWSSGCLLGGSGTTGTVAVIVNPKRRDASVLSSPPPGTGISALSCTRPGHCLALVTSTTQTTVDVTDDSGSSWRSLSVLPATLAVGTALACANSADCVAVGTGPTGAGAVWTRDGGVRWSAARLPGHLQAFTAAACAPATWCVATASLADHRAVLLRSVNDGRSWASLSTAVTDPDAVACTVARSCVAGGGDGHGGQLSTFATMASESPLTLAYVPDPILAVACATPRKCVGVTQESTVSFVI